MPTKSLFTDLIIDTPEAAENLLKAFELREKLGPWDTSHALEVIRDHDEIRKIFKLND